MPRYKKPNGITIDINPSSEAYARSLNWEKIGEIPEPKSKKKESDKDSKKATGFKRILGQ